MLDRSKLFKAIEQVEHELFFDSSLQINAARQIWQEICEDLTFQAKVRKKGGELYPPSWFEDLGTVYPVTSTIQEYCALSVDGSQVYPDKHQGTSCFLINLGTVVIQYGSNPLVVLESQPLVFTGQYDEDIPDLSRDTVNCLRQAHEFERGLELLRCYTAQDAKVPTLLLFDGSLIFWHLASKEAEVKEHYVAQHVAIFSQLYHEQSPMAGYISMPRSKELVSLIRLKLSDFNPSDEIAMSAVDRVVDASIVAGFLKPFERTIVFQSNAPLCTVYPQPLRPHFFYMNVGGEIARVEICAWLAERQDLVDLVATIICDQAIKGSGYPVVIAEAHEQAVVKGADRDYFYQLIEQAGAAYGRTMVGSQKSVKKRTVGY